MTKKFCPVLRCEHPIADRQILCHRHWSSVPEDIKEEVRAAKREEGEGPLKVAAARAARFCSERQLDQEEADQMAEEARWYR